MLSVPEVFTDEDGGVHVRCDRPGVQAVSQRIGDGGPEAVIAFIGQLAAAADLEVDDTENVDGLGPVTIGVAPGA